MKVDPLISIFSISRTLEMSMHLKAMSHSDSSFSCNKMKL